MTRTLNEYHFIDSLDYLLLPFYLLALSVIAVVYIRQEETSFRKLFLSAFTLKIAGSIAYALVYQYYYHGGDTSWYFETSLQIQKAPRITFLQTMQLIFYPFDSTVTIRENLNNVSFAYILFPNNFFPVRILLFLNQFTFNTYLNNSLLFGFLSLLGTWRNFRVFTEIYPAMKKKFAIAFLYMPSVLFWTSGVSKDAIVYAAFSFFSSFLFELICQKKIHLKTFIGIFVSAFFVYAIKPYILISFLAGAAIWLYFDMLKLIKLLPLGRIFSMSVSLTLTLILILKGNELLTVVNNEIFNKLFTTIYEMNVYLKSFENSSTYDIGLSNMSVDDVSPSFFFKKLPLAFATAMFRPLIFEAKNPFMILSSLEGLFAAALTIIALVKSRVIYLFALIFKDKLISILFIYCIIFSFFIALTSSNFGTLVRYKTPCFSVYVAVLYLIIEKTKNLKQPVEKQK